MGQQLNGRSGLKHREYCTHESFYAVHHIFDNCSYMLVTASDIAVQWWRYGDINDHGYMMVAMTSEMVVMMMVT